MWVENGDRNDIVFDVVLSKTVAKSKIPMNICHVNATLPKPPRYSPRAEKRVLKNA